MQKCRELNAELVTNSAKVQSAMKLSEDDKNAIASLRKEIEKAWKMVDAAHEKEQRAKETIQSLRIEINNLSKLVEQGAGMKTFFSSPSLVRSKSLCNRSLATHHKECLLSVASRRVLINDVFCHDEHE